MKGGKGEGSSTKNPHAAPPVAARLCTTAVRRWGKVGFARTLGAPTGRGSPRETAIRPPPIITPRIRLHLGLCAVGGGSLRRSKEGSVTSRLGWPARKEGVLLQLSATLPLFVTWHITFGRIYIFQSCPSFTIPSCCLD